MIYSFKSIKTNLALKQIGFSIKCNCAENNSQTISFMQCIPIQFNTQFLNLNIKLLEIYIFIYKYSFHRMMIYKKIIKLCELI